MKNLKIDKIYKANDKDEIYKKNILRVLSKLLLVTFIYLLLLLIYKNHRFHKNMENKRYTKYYNDSKYLNISDLNTSTSDSTNNMASHTDTNEAYDKNFYRNDSETSIYFYNKTNLNIKSFSNSTLTSNNNSDLRKEEKENKSQKIESNKKRIGVVGISNSINIGNNLVKYGMYIKLKEFGLEPVIIAKNKRNSNSYFIEKYTKFKEIKYSFNELKEKDFDILMVNSDQTWSYSDYKNLFNYGLLKFARNWAIPKFIYGASLGKELWMKERSKKEYAKLLLKDFTGISFREKETIRLVERYLNIKSELVIDPSFLIEKHYYINLIKDYKRDFNFSKKYLFVYQLDKDENLIKVIKNVKKEYNFNIYNVSLDDIDPKYYVEDFIFGINASEAIITDSYHATLFSIMFDKPFISYINFGRGILRFKNLKECFHLDNRIIEKGNYINISLLLEPLNINRTYLNELRNSSLNYLKKNLGVE